MTRDALRSAYNAALDHAEREVDTWRCPRCLSEAQWPGSIHIEWGNPECHPCAVGGVQIQMTLVAIEKVH